MVSLMNVRSLAMRGWPPAALSLSSREQPHPCVRVAIGLFRAVKLLQRSPLPHCFFKIVLLSRLTGKRRYNKEGPKMWKTFTDVFNTLPIAAIVDERIFCVYAATLTSAHLEAFC